VVVPQTVIIAPPVVVPPPIEVWVPYEQRKHWGKHCSKYNACGVPVYFVRDDWYNDHVRHPKGPPAGKGPPHGKGHGKKQGRRVRACVRSGPSGRRATG
jgi:hypothetical protein